MEQHEAPVMSLSPTVKFYGDTPYADMSAPPIWEDGLYVLRREWEHEAALARAAVRELDELIKERDKWRAERDRFISLLDATVTIFEEVRCDT